MKKPWKASALALLSVVGLTLSACGGGSEANNEAITSNQVADYAPTPRDQIKDGGELTVPIAEVPEQENPFHADMTTNTGDIWSLYNPELATFTPEGEFAPNEDYLAKVEDKEENNKTIVTYTFRDEAQFNDGTPMDWKSIENTWRFSNGEMPGIVPHSTDGYKLIESVTKGETDKQAVVTFKQVYPWWMGLFNIVLPPQVKTAEDFNNGFLNKVHPEWGAGPFKLENIDFHTGTVTVVRNDKWWGDPAKLERITYRQMEDTASMNAFRAGEVDATGVGNKDRFENAKKMGDQAEIRIGKAPKNALLTLNAQAGPLKDDKVREAVLTGIDRKQIAEIRFNGLNYSEESPGSFLLFDSQEGYEDNFGKIVSFDAEKAKSILEEAGWKEGQDGIREKNGQTLQLSYTLFGDDPLTKAMATAIQQMLRGIGIDLSIRERPSSEFSDVMQHREFDILLMAFQSGDPYGVAYFDQIYNSESELNKSGTGSAEFDKKIVDLTKIHDPKEQIAKGNELEQEAFSFHGIMPLFNGPAIIAVKPGLVNYGPKMFGTVKIQDIGWKAE
ncbi:ABC transporter family substrate-binding protein [Corynebacterium uropygiale]|uniref:ABC transporter family substrate-binding protein n=1 Tax=Corynebacterium uropygiale TaxID=1775911 RepID=A0A9X1U762_9CORY|nr:ABC transporter family substrate-binding protein [Corynebacterium uropygiale]MCF4006427.1 ABC transporter family substrate-binding protein [Corynebacterium uropygiale]